MLLWLPMTSRSLFTILLQILNFFLSCCCACRFFLASLTYFSDLYCISSWRLQIMSPIYQDYFVFWSYPPKGVYMLWIIIVQTGKDGVIVCCDYSPRAIWPLMSLVAMTFVPVTSPKIHTCRVLPYLQGGKFCPPHMCIARDMLLTAPKQANSTSVPSS